MKTVGIKGFGFAALLASCVALTGCFQVQGVHVLHDSGESDTGSYRISMNPITYAVLQKDNAYSKLMGELRQWSRPVTRSSGDLVYLEDNSGYASMEHFYDRATCRDSSIRGYRDCRFGFDVPSDIAKLSDWSVDWEVVLQRDMQLLASNHQRERVENGLRRLVWYFDGNRDSSGNVDFTVRVPISDQR